MSINDEMPGGARPEPINQAQPVEWRINPRPGDTQIANAHNTLTAVADEHAKYLVAVDAQKDNFSEAGLRQQVSAFGETSAAKAVDIAEQAATERTAQAQADYARVLEGLSPKGDAAVEIRNERTLRRAERALTGAEPGAVAATAQRLIAEAQPEALGVLLTELPSLVQSRGVPGDVVERAATKAVPALADAARKLTKARQSEAIVRNNVARVRDGIAKGYKLRAPLVDPANYDPDR
jgi:hypothetical protein